MIKRLLPKIFIALLFLVCGALLLADGLKAQGVDFSINAFWPTLIIGLGTALLISAFCYSSTGYLYFFGFLVSLGSIFLYSHYTSRFSNLNLLWPLFIGCPGVASLIMFFVRKFNVQHLKMALLFLGVSIGLYLANSSIIAWEIIIPIVVVLVGFILLANIIFRRNKSWDMADNETAEYIPYTGNADEVRGESGDSENEDEN